MADYCQNGFPNPLELGELLLESDRTLELAGQLHETSAELRRRAGLASAGYPLRR
jgi:hypothetical protein